MTFKPDLNALARDLSALEQELRAEIGPDDLKHLKKIEGWGRLCSAVGFALAWIAPNPLSMALISQGTFSRWAIIAHHVLHRGYDKVPGAPSRLTSQIFARGWRRFLDWPDWIHPTAWSYEHNALHHYKLGEVHDPDQPELNGSMLRSSGLPLPLRYLAVAVAALSWKWLYYAPNTCGELHFKEMGTRKEAGERLDLLNPRLWLPFTDPGYKLWLRS